MKIYVFGAAAALALAAGCAHQSETEVAKQQYPYNQPLTSPGGKFAALPLVVQSTVRAQVGMADVLDAVKDTSSGRPVYKVYFRDSASYPPLFVGPDGSVLYPDLTVAVPARKLTVVKPEDVPPEVMDVAVRKCNLEIASINKEMWGGRVVYLFCYKDDPKTPKLIIAADGTVLEETLH